MQVEDRCADGFFGVVVVDVGVGAGLGSAPDPRDAVDLVFGDLDLAREFDDRRQDDVADVVERFLHRAELLDGQSHRVPHERADGVPGDGLADVVEQSGRPFPRFREGHPCETVQQTLAEANHRQRRDRLGRGLYLGSISHHHRTQGTWALALEATKYPGRHYAH